jgi:hypothetical protein
VIGGNDKDMPCMNWRMADIVYSCSAQVGWLAKERVVFRFKVRWLVSAGAVWFHFLTIAASAGAPQLVMPLACEVGRSCAIQQYVDHDASSGDRDYRCGTLTYNGHNGTDFRLPTTAIQRAGIDVLAAAAGQVLRTRDGMPDALLAAPTDPSANRHACGNGVVLSHGDGWETQYCHLAKGSVRVRPGERVLAGQAIGRVGLSGRTEFPHLHLTVRHEGQIVDPFAHGAAEGSCDGGVSLWSPSFGNALAYRARAVLNVGFADGPVTMEKIESGETNGIHYSTEAPALVAFVRAIGLKAGDVQRLSVKSPDGQLIVDKTEEPLDRNKAQTMIFAGQRRPPEGWPKGSYRAIYGVLHGGQVVLEQRFSMTF